MILLVSAAVVLDFKTWRIPNWLVLIGMETDICDDPERGLENGRHTGGTWYCPSGCIAVPSVSIWIPGSRRYQAVCSPWCIYRNGGLADRSVFVSVWWGFVFAVYGKECMDPMAEASKTKTAPKE